MAPIPVTWVRPWVNWRTCRCRARARAFGRNCLSERYQRRQAQLDAAIGEMFVFGTSMPRVGEVVETLTGLTLSPATVSTSVKPPFR